MMKLNLKGVEMLRVSFVKRQRAEGPAGRGRTASPRAVKWAAALLALAFLLSIGASAGRAQTPDNWIGGTSNWNSQTNWSTSTVPNNGGGTFYNVNIIGLGSDVVTFDAFPTTVDTLTLGSGETLQDNGSSVSLTIGGSTNTNSGTLSNSGTINWGNGSMLTIGTAVGNAKISNNGTLNISDSTLQVNGDFANNSGNLTIGNASSGTITGTLTNTSTGTVLVQGGSALFGGTLNTSGAVTVDGTSVLNIGTFTQTGGTFTLEPGARVSAAAWNIQGGTQNLQGQMLTLTPPTGTATNAGTLNLQLGTSLTINGGAINLGSIVTGNGVSGSGSNSLNVSALLTNNGSISLNAGGDSVTAGSFASSGNVFLNNGTSLLTTGNLSNSGSLLVNGGCGSCSTGFVPVTVGGSVTNTGNIDLPPTQDEVLRGGLTMDIAQSVYNSGDIAGGIIDALILLGPTEVPESPIFRGSFAPSAPPADFNNLSGGSLSLTGMGETFKLTNGSFNNNAGASLTLSGGNDTVMVASTFVNGGMVTLSGSGETISVTGAGGYLQNAGTTQGTGTIEALAGGVTINGGTITPDAPGTPGKLTINGNYTQGPLGTLTIDITGKTTFSLLDVMGSASLDGAVDFDFVNFTPSAGETFTFLTAGSVSGLFSSDAFKGFGCANCTLAYGNGTVTLDINGTAPVPEPSTWLMVGTGLLAMAAFGMMQRRRPRRA